MKHGECIVSDIHVKEAYGMTQQEMDTSRRDNAIKPKKAWKH